MKRHVEGYRQVTVSQSADADEVENCICLSHQPWFRKKAVAGMCVWSGEVTWGVDVER